MFGVQLRKISLYSQLDNVCTSAAILTVKRKHSHAQIIIIIRYDLLWTSNFLHILQLDSFRLKVYSSNHFWSASVPLA